MNKPRITIYDIAREAEVSPATVSRVLSGTVEVSEQRRLRVMQVVNKYDFRPSATARSLKTRTSMRVGVVVPDISNPYFANLYMQVERRLSEFGLITMLCNSFSDMEKELEILRAMERDNVRAVLFQGAMADAVCLDEELLKRFNAFCARLPILSITVFPGAECAMLRQDGAAEGIRALAAHLCARGYRRFGFVGGRMDVRQTMTRRTLFRQALEGLGAELPERWIMDGGYDHVSGYEGMKALLGMDARPDAVLCFNDYVAAGAQQALYALGVRVPQDMAVAGCDDVFPSAVLQPPLTTLRPDYDALVEGMLEFVVGTYKEPPRVDVRLVVRQST